MVRKRRIRLSLSRVRRLFGTCAVPLEPYHALNFHEPRRAAGAYERAQQTGGRTDIGNARTEQGVRNVVHRLIEVGGVEDVIRLRSEGESDVLADGHILQQRDIGVEEMRTVDGVASHAAKAGWGAI